MMAFKVDVDGVLVELLEKTLFKGKNRKMIEFLQRVGFSRVRKEAYKQLKKDICRIIVEYLKKCDRKSNYLTKKKLPRITIKRSEFGSVSIVLH